MTDGVKEVQANLEAYRKQVYQKAENAAGKIAALLEGYAKSHHPWKPQTGATDVSTVGTWEQVGEEVFRVVLSAGMEYDVFLESARQGRWAWLWPAVDENRDEIKRIWVEELSV